MGGASRRRGVPNRTDTAKRRPFPASRPLPPAAWAPPPPQATGRFAAGGQRRAPGGDNAGRRPSHEPPPFPQGRRWTLPAFPTSLPTSPTHFLYPLQRHGSAGRATGSAAGGGVWSSRLTASARAAAAGPLCVPAHAQREGVGCRSRGTPGSVVTGGGRAAPWRLAARTGPAAATMTGFLSLYRKIYCILSVGFFF